MNRFRYERKFLTELFPDEPEVVIRDNPAHFQEVFQPRFINNIYFDTPGFSFYYDNIEGERKRVKVRIRWYGDDHTFAGKPVLEYKIKNGFFGEKKNFPLRDFQVTGENIRAKLREVFCESHLPDEEIHWLSGLNPVLFNRYLRSYYLSADGRFRLTLDDKLSYASCSPGEMNFVTTRKDPDHRIFELKYDVEDDEDAQEISRHFPFRLTKNSKYLTGVELVCL